jgi:hypothetical protein
MGSCGMCFYCHKLIIPFISYDKESEMISAERNCEILLCKECEKKLMNIIDKINSVDMINPATPEEVEKALKIIDNIKTE